MPTFPDDIQLQFISKTHCRITIVWSNTVHLAILPSFLPSLITQSPLTGQVLLQFTLYLHYIYTSRIKSTLFLNTTKYLLVCYSSSYCALLLTTKILQKLLNIDLCRSKSETTCNTTTYFSGWLKKVFSWLLLITSN